MPGITVQQPSGDTPYSRRITRGGTMPNLILEQHLQRIRQLCNSGQSQLIGRFETVVFIRTAAGLEWINGGNYGKKFKEDARRYYGSFFYMSGRGEMIPNEDSFCDLDPTRGHEQAGSRPAVVISVEQLSAGASELAIVVPLSRTDRPSRSKWRRTAASAARPSARPGCR